jgi:excisionase family DNA binding protein
MKEGAMIDENDLTVYEVAKMLGVTGERVRQLVNAGALKAQKLGNRGNYIIRREDAEALTKQRTATQ